MRECLVRRTRVAIGCALIAAAGCAAPAQIRYEREVEDAAPEALHGVHSQRLVELMRGLERLRGARLPNAMDVAAAEADREREIEQVSRALAASAQAILMTVTGDSMSDAERREFLRLAAQLERDADALGASSARSPDEIRTRVMAIEGTCQACHQRFRIPEGSDAP